ncbi:N-acetyltransferase [Endozoicomonas gorgoniicola]|uniref:N-acetyltransferase n=1 Tax=Endozoicomonas gorgoniicola TaxID=1234144 RepID=A0ABT3MYR9_9GAMM|nr:N-acetyltransferase [Endozoicomonas gorgoniicola]MCW7554144.1 N-acetyltransferase [Endozoicomonas gorgoniicola]
MKIRKETSDDINTIRHLVYAAFKGHPHHKPGAEPTEHTIIDLLRESNELSLSLVAELNGKIIGHIAFSPVRINGQDSHWLGLGPVAVLPDAQGKGIGSALINEAIKQLKEKGISGFVVLGEPEYYSRFGFSHYSELTLPGVPQEYFMGLSNSSEIPTGEVTYSSAFG